KSHAGERPPGPAQEVGFRCFSRDPAMLKNIAVRPPLQGGSGRDVAFSLAVDSAVLKNGNGRTENKIHCTFNITVFVVLAAVDPERVQGILEAEKPAIFKNGFIAFDPERHGLAYRTGRILERDVF